MQQEPLCTRLALRQAMLRRAYILEGGGLRYEVLPMRGMKVWYRIQLICTQTWPMIRCLSHKATEPCTDGMQVRRRRTDAFIHFYLQCKLPGGSRAQQREL